MSIATILDKVEGQPFKRACLTGGEPLLQPDTKALISVLLEKGYVVDIETNGSIDLKDFPKSESILYSMDIKCPLSGSSEEMLLDNVNYLTKKDQVKFIISDMKDYEYAKKIIDKRELIAKTNVIVTSVGGIDCQRIVERVLEDSLDVRIGLQIHKVIFGPTKRGV